MKRKKTDMPGGRLRIEGPPIGRIFDEVTDTLKFCNDRFYAFPAALVACSAINAIGSFLLVDAGKPATYPPNKERFDACIGQYFPSKYHAVSSRLWKSLRCALSHVLTVGRDVAGSCRNDKRHLHLTEVDGWFFVSMLELVEDLSEAMSSYLRDLETDAKLQAKLRLRLKLEADADKP
jgi:hypothetical protein